MNVRTTQILTFEKKGVQPKHENGVRWGVGVGLQRPKIM